MRYLLVDLHNFKRKIIPICEYDFEKVHRTVSYKYSCREITKPPSARTLRRWKNSSRCKAICGCWIDNLSGERCSIHNCMSWLSALIGVHPYAY
jgi:hypothetical protein